MLFNKSNNGAQELQDRTGSYFANNDFSRIATDVMLSESGIIRLVGKEVYELAYGHYSTAKYMKVSPTAQEKILDKLVHLLQTTIGYEATFNYYQSNLVSHKDSGRKVGIDNDNEKMAWEWMLDRDDMAHVKKIHQTRDLLINYLEEVKVNEWMNSENRIQARKLFVNTEAIFQDAYPIDMSPSFFYTTLAFNREVQTHTIKKALGSVYDDLLTYWIGLSSHEDDGSGSGSGSASIDGEAVEEDPLLLELLPMVQQVIPLLVMEKAIKRLSVQALPDGVVQQFKSGIQSRNASNAALKDVMEWNVLKLRADALELLDDIKIILQSADPEANSFKLIPENKETNKYMRT